VTGPDALAAAVLTAAGLPPATRTQRTTGQDAAVWRADLVDGRTVAVRLLRPGVAADAELAALTLAAAEGHPAPTVVATGRHGGRDAIVMSWCPGRTVGELLQSGGDPGVLGRLFGRGQAALHRPVPGRSAVLCHLDYQPFNVLTDGSTVTGIVDWANARLGDAREDLAWTRVVLALAPALLPDLAAGLPAFTAAWQAGYRERAPMPDDADLAPFLAAAARKQLAEWMPRAAAGACPTEVLGAAERIAARWEPRARR
jgi:Ser/Thr protein kinase RdoA (MazF antagonist)